MLQAIRGLSPSSFMFFWGIRFDPSLAGMRQLMVKVTLLLRWRMRCGLYPRVRGTVAFYVSLSFI